MAVSPLPECSSEIVLIAYYYIILRDNGAEPSDSKDNRPV